MPRIRSILAVLLVLAVAAPLVAQEFPPATKETEARLLGVLKDAKATREARSAACRQLAVVATKDAVPILAGLLADENLSHMARYALEPIPDPSVDKALRDALGKVKGRLLVGVIGSVGVRRDAAAVPVLAGMLGDLDADVAQAAARALGSIGTPEAAKALTDALPRASRANQLAFCEGLLRAAERLADAGKADEAVAVYDRLRSIEKAPHQVRTAAVRGAILARGHDGVALLGKVLGDDDFHLFAAACRTTCEMRGADVTKALASVLGKGSADRRILALQALGKRSDATGLRAVLDAAKAGDKPVRLQAIQTVAEIGDPAAADALVALMADDDRDVAAGAQECLASLPGEKIDAVVIKMLDGKDTGRRIAAIELIGRRRMTSAIPQLRQAADSDDAKIRAAAMRQWGALAGRDQLPAMLDLLMAAKDAKAGQAAEAAVAAVCAKVEPPEAAAEALAARLDKAGVAQKAALVRLLAAVGGEKALVAVRGALADSNAEVHDTAVRALSEWKTPDALPILLDLAKTTENARDRTLALRGYLGWATRTRGGVPGRERLEMARTAAGLVQTTGEKRLLLAALGKINSPVSVNLAVAYLDDKEIRDEACSAIVSVAENLLKLGGKSQAAARMVEPLEKVVQAGPEGSLAKRAKAALQRARQRAGEK